MPEWHLNCGLQGLRIAIGNIFIPVFTWITDKIAAVKSSITWFIEAFPGLSKLVIGGTGAVMGLAAAVLTLNGAMMAVQGAAKVWSMAQKAAGSSMTKFLYTPLMSGVKWFKNFRSWGYSTGEALKFTFKQLGQDAGASIKGVLKALWSIPGPIKILIGLAGLLYAAYKTNFAGLRDRFTAISAGWNFAAAASADGITEIDEATAQSLEKAGLWDLAQNMGKVFFRLREFVTGFKDGLNA